MKSIIDSILSVLKVFTEVSRECPEEPFKESFSLEKCQEGDEGEENNKDHG